MKIWNVTIGEPLPIDGNKNRLHRAGLLNSILVQQGHDVTWWASTFEHFSKTHIYGQNTSVAIEPNYRLELLHGCAYHKNVSINRLRNHYQIGREFYHLAKKKEKPDQIFVAFPAIELAYYASKYALENNIPIIVDARDMWPDIFVDVLPVVTRPMAKLVLTPYFRMTKFVFSNATGITGITDGFVNWGLQYASRKNGPNDSSFYLGYPSLKNDPEKVADSWERWLALGLGNDDFIISYIGAVAHNKIDFSPILQAALCYKDDPNIKFVLAGEGDERQRFMDEVKRLGLKNIIFPGWIDKYQISSLLRKSSLGLVPLKNRKDYKVSIPNKPIEYFANNLPVITSLRGELQDLVVKTGTGVFYENASDMVSWIDFFREKQNRLDEMASNCNRLFSQLFESQNVYSRLAEHLTDVHQRCRSS